MALRKCPKCNGTGCPPEAASFGGWLGEKCPLCHGTGYIDDGAIEIHVRHKYDE